MSYSKKQAIVDYWEKNLYKKHGMHEWDMGCDFSDASTRCWRCGNQPSRLEMAHIRARQFLPEEDKKKFEVFNLVILCNFCHKEAPDINDDITMWSWIKNTSHATYGEFVQEKTNIEYKNMYGISIQDNVKELSDKIDASSFSSVALEEIMSKLNKNVFKDCGYHGGTMSYATRAVAWSKAINGLSIELMGLQSLNDRA